MCVKSCTSNSQCGTHGFCDVSLPVPNCTCQPGYTGATCADCAPNYVRDTAMQCILAAIPGSTAFIGAGLMAGVNTLLAIDPSGSTVTAIRPLPSTAITQLAADVDSKALYALDNTGIKKLDIATGALTAVATLASSTNLTWGPGGLFSIPNLSPYLLKRINVMNGGIADLGSTGLLGVQALAYDPSSGALIATRWGTSSPELHRVSASDGVVTPMGTLTYDPAALPPSNTRIGLAVDPNTAFVYAVTAVGRTPDALFAKHCRQIAAGLGLTGYDSAPIGAMEYPTNGIGVGLTKVMGSQNASAKRSSLMPATPRWAPRRPPSASTPRIPIPSSVDDPRRKPQDRARLDGEVRGHRVHRQPTAPRHGIEGVREVTSPPVHIALQSETYLDPSVRAYAIDRVYTTAEWGTTKKLPYITTLWGSDSTAPNRLVQIDLATNKPARILNFNGVELQNLLAPWKP